MDEKYFNEDNLKSMLTLIDEIISYEENSWFKDELRLLISNGNGLTSTKLKEIKDDTNKIINYLDISHSCNVDYSFVHYPTLRSRLELDNVRMQNVRYDLSERDETKRMYDYIINAFYQIEALINYYFFEKYPVFTDLLDHLESCPGSTFRRNIENNIGDITIANKIFCFNANFYPRINGTIQDYTGMNIDNLRKIRNEGSHRMFIIKTNEDQNPRLNKFLKNTTYESIHALLNSLANTIRTNIDEPVVKKEEDLLDDLFDL